MPTQKEAERPADGGQITNSGDTGYYTVKIGSDEHDVEAMTRLSAKYRAASAHKESDSGPDVGNVDQLAAQATIIESSE